MKKVLFAGLAAVGLAGTAFAEQAPPQPPQSPAPATGPQRPDGRRHELRSFDMHMMGPDESARILPPGAWWKDQDLAKRIDLTPEQQKRIEDTFLQNKITLIHMHASLEEQELLLGPMLDANPIDQGKVLAQIGKIADTRADLEKANAKMLLQIRGVLSQAQWTKLQQERPGSMHLMFRGPAGPHSLNFVLPAMNKEMDRLQAQMRAMPPVDVQKLKEQLRAMPPIDPQKLQQQLREQLQLLPDLAPLQ